MKVWLSCTLAAVACFALAQPSPTEDFVLSGATAYGMLTPEPVAGGVVRSLAWSDDGKFLLVQRQDLGSASAMLGMLTGNQNANASVEQSIVVYNLAERKQTVLWRAKVLSMQLHSVEWFRGSSTAVAVVVERLRTTDPSKPNPTREHVVVLDARTGSSRIVFSVDQNEDPAAPVSDVTLALSPVKPFGLIAVQTRKPTNKTASNGRDWAWSFQYRLISADGSVSGPATIDDGAFITGWIADGSAPILNRFGFDSEGKVWRESQVLDLSTGRLTKGKGASYLPQPSKKPLIANPGTATVVLDTAKRDLHSAWLISEGGDARAMISGDVTAVELSPTLSGVAYISQGVALMRPIIQMPKEAFLNALKAAEKMRIMSNAKQVGLAFLMFSADNDDMLPSGQADIGGLLAPYMKNSSIFSGFVYSFPGGLLTEVKEPANTVMGYMPGVGGRAVVYLDGHVKWQPDQ